MTTPPFDTEDLFDEDYLHFAARPLEETSDAAAGLVERLLELRPGERVLDLACGHGRIANRLAARGLEVSGLDITPVFLDRARQDAHERGVEVDYVRGDMRELPWTGHFDAIVNWFTAFGYFDDAGNRRVLDQARQALRPGGRLLLELNNQAHVLRAFQQAIVHEADGDLLVDRHRLDPLTSRNIVERTIVRAGRVRRFHYFTRMFAFPELRDWLLAAGFDEVEGFGEDGGPLTADSRRMLVLARR
ncbi:methyltransferase family protein [Saccharopolyspora erythraea NRRL 2338]|uniref:Methyltransferase n=2 Tax=Saccharopolyspora erythraea TaxID=1836 RepID=A4FAA5_SACEN|nr:class I SAM-dependent methyltransferase [Saccharopolyspora erythraea]EQD86442.1 SAM-dependent methyltransferase [Saccharopolyspora erythraea D]PFG94766.1 methyltransferase family protein [Saccharopolyspora erythraea NRRL 2338]QRK91486.1 class I SAM-dependent methyltransferase [Saccharopolyspora erythraea]CAM00980.1 methyltransferase [Saccharopolyspora erythraea NRRL 2338]